MQFILLAKIILFFLGTISFVVYVFSGLNRNYLLYLGFGFCGLGISLFFTIAVPLFLSISLLLTLYSFIMSIIEAIKDTKERVAAFRIEQIDRETAFAEFQAALIENEKKKSEDIKSEAEEDISSTP